MRPAAGHRQLVEGKARRSDSQLVAAGGAADSDQQGAVAALSFRRGAARGLRCHHQPSLPTVSFHFFTIFLITVMLNFLFVSVLSILYLFHDY